MTTEQCKILLGDGSYIDIYLKLNWLDLPIEKVVVIRDVIDKLRRLGEAPEKRAEDEPVPAEGSAPARSSERPTLLVHKCDVGDCGRGFASRHALAVHQSRSHRDVVPAEGSAEEGPSEEPSVYTCATCMTTADSYTKLAEHTMGWHRRHPTAAERAGLEPDDGDEEAAPEAQEPEEAAPAKSYLCDDCVWTGVDGRELFKHTEKTHSRKPHTWERQLRMASERGDTRPRIVV